MIAYRNEKLIPIDITVFTMYEKFKEAKSGGTTIGGEIELNEENQAIYDTLK